MNIKKMKIDGKISTLIISLIAIVTTLVSYQYLSTTENRAKERYQLVKTFVVISDIPIGESLQTAFASLKVSPKQILKDDVPLNAILTLPTNISEIFAQQELRPGQILLTSQFATTLPKVGLLPIPAGQVAVSVSILDVGRVADFIRPGIKVGVYSSVGKEFTRTLFENLLILAIGNQTIGAYNTPTVSGIITFAAYPKDAARLIYASRNSDLYLVIPSSTLDRLPNDVITSDNLFSNSTKLIK
jgi:Flp pilus assembly protein CpaB